MTRFGWKVLLIGLKILKGLRLKGKVTNITQLCDESARFYSKLQNWLRKVMQGTLLCLRNRQMLLKKLTNLLEFEDIHNRPPSISWNRITMIFLWAQGGRCIFTKSVLYLSVYSQYFDEVQDQFCDLRNNSSARDIFHEMLFSRF